jgi:16S rRNA (uracil1498-N3)-methyltransferase
VNVVLLEPGELADDGTARLSGRRAEHVRAVLRAADGQQILAGVVGGRLGEAEILAGGAGAETGAPLVLRPALDRDPPPPSPVALLLALPRPKMLRRVLQATAAMGVKRVALAGSYRVEKSYFASPFLAPAAIRAELLLGLEQGRDTVLPEVTVHRFFKPFLEDALDAIFPSPARLLAHTVEAAPLEAHPAPTPAAGATLAVGPEGGWTAYEAGRLREKGFLAVSLGPRPLRVDAAVPYAVGQVELWLRGRRG